MVYLVVGSILSSVCVMVAWALVYKRQHPDDDSFEYALRHYEDDI